MPNVFITGANGFIGSNLSRYFLEKNLRVYGLVRKTSDLHFLDGFNIELIYGDLNDVKKIELPPDLDYIVHCASVVSDAADEKTCEKNIYQGTVDFVNHILASKIKFQRFIYLSTSLVLGYRKLNISEENPGKSALFLPYVKYKLEVERYLLDLHKKNAFPLVILRPADVYGPNDRVSCVPILKGIEDGVPLIVGSGKWIFPLCYVENLCQAIYLACVTKNVEGRAYTITNGSDVTWKEFFSAFLKRLNRRQRVHIPVFLPYVIAFVMKIIHLFVPSYEPPLTFYRIKRVTSHTNYDISKTIKELNYNPDQDTEKQLNAIMDWYLAEKASGYIK
jgi:nucleoside-diphosphate-sugar epimerase